MYQCDGKLIFPDMGKLDTHWNRFSKGYVYKNDGIKDAAQKLLRDAKTTAQRRLAEVPSPACRCFVVSSRFTTTPPERFLFRNYALDVDTEENVDLGTNQCAAWEAALATSAAPSYLPQVKIKLQPSHEDIFEDGGYQANNPTNVALDELAELFPYRSVSCVVSLGTGKPSTAYKRAQGLFKGAKTLMQQVMVHVVDAATNSEKTHKDVKRRLQRDKVPYFRLNPEDGVGDVDLAGTSEDDLVKMLNSTENFLKEKHVQDMMSQIIALTAGQ